MTEYIPKTPHVLYLNYHPKKTQRGITTPQSSISVRRDQKYPGRGDQWPTTKLAIENKAATAQKAATAYKAYSSACAPALPGQSWAYRPPPEVEDIVQETYVRVCQVKHPENIRQSRSYLFRTARNLALDYLKRAETKYPDGMDEQDIDSLVDTKAGDDSTFDQVTSNQEFALFCQAVRHLPVKCRRVFVLKPETKVTI